MDKFTVFSIIGCVVTAIVLVVLVIHTKEIVNENKNIAMSRCVAQGHDDIISYKQGDGIMKYLCVGANGALFVPYKGAE